MKLNDEQKKALGKKLSRLNSKCYSCGQTGFTVLDKLFEMREFNEGSLVIGGENSTIPAVVMVCNTCGEIRLLSALALRVLDNTEKQVKKDGSE